MTDSASPQTDFYKQNLNRLIPIGEGMKLLFLVALFWTTLYAADNEAEGEIAKRRGWGKRGNYPMDTLADDDNNGVGQDLSKRRGWGKRSEGNYEKRSGWGKRSDIDTNLVEDEEMDKRNGWGKRSSEIAWGKRSRFPMFYPYVMPNDPDFEYDKRRGWGKRSNIQLNEVEEYKRRRWGKR